MKLKNFIHLVMTLCIFIQSTWSYGFSAYSNQELDELEKQFKQTIFSSPLIIRNPLAKTYINQVAQRLSQHAHMDKPYFFIVNSAEINAFAGPGGYIGINTQLILATETESQLAAVMAHEMAHVRLHHLYRTIEHQKQMQIPQLASLLAAAALSIVNPALGSGALMGAMTEFQQDSINYIRSHEKEADNIGIHILSAANFNPQGMPDFFKKMQENMRYYYTDNIPAILRTHPLDEDRIAEAENRIAQLSNTPHPPSSQDYYFFKELIRHEVQHDPQKLIIFYQKQCQKISPNYACAYGLALSYLELGKTSQAQQLLQPFTQQKELEHNPFFKLAFAKTEQNLGKSHDAHDIYQKFYLESPNNSALINQYSEFLNSENAPKQALSILMKAHRKMPQDLGICLKLARTQAQLKMIAEAYFTEANCHLIQGDKKAALTQLKVAQKYTQAKSYMYERIQAKIDEISDTDP